MREISKRRHARVPAALALVVAASLASAAASPSAGAITLKELKEDFAPFANCPVATAKLCVVSTTTGGEVALGRKQVPIDKTLTLQGGLPMEAFAAQPLIGPVGAETLSKTPLTVPGGLVGIEGLGGEVTATAELAGPVEIDRGNLILHKGAAVTLPLKVKLDNPTLGNECFIGSDADPIVLHLTSGQTSPPLPFSPISGSFAAEGLAKGKIVAGNASLVDNDFAVPGASGCGGALAGVIDPIVDLDAGIPAPPGASTAILTGRVEETNVVFAVKFKPKPKR